MVVDLAGRAVGTEARPSAETALHTQIYRRYSDAGAVLHTHSRTQTVASRVYAEAGLVRSKAGSCKKRSPATARTKARWTCRVFANTQEMAVLVAEVDAWLDAGKPLSGYLIDGHGIYTWGRDMAETLRHLEAFEFLLGCELDLLQLRGSSLRGNGP